MYENALRQDEVISNASPRMQRIRAAAGFLLGAALLACFLGADAGSQGFISVSNGAFVDANCTEFIPVGWNSCDLSCLLSCRPVLECTVHFMHHQSKSALAYTWHQNLYIS